MSGMVRTGMRIVALLIFLLLVGSNISTQYRAIRFVNADTLQTDPIVHRLDPRAPEWRRLREMLSPSAETPVLLSGFHDTPTPHWLAIGTDPVPHFLGSSILAFWDIWPALTPVWLSEYHDRTPFDPDWLWTQITAGPLAHRDETNARYLAHSRQALVPVGASYPVEWGARLSLAGPVAVRVTN